MVRHTGDYLLGTVFLAAALILQLSQAPVHSAAKSSRYNGPADAANYESPVSSKSAKQTAAIAKAPARSVSAALNNLPRGTRIVVGSLDVTGNRHRIRLTSHNDDSSTGNTLAVARFSNDSIHRRGLADAMRSLTSRSPSKKNRQVVQTAALELQPEEATVPHGISKAVYTQNTEMTSVSERLVNINQASTNSKAAIEQSTRLFLIPHFSSSGTIHTPRACRAIAASQRVQVYLDESLSQTSSSHEMQPRAERVVTAVEIKALPIVEKWIGLVSDIDRNDRLSIVITDLDDEVHRTADRSPIFGCIRESDFCSESDFCGDIVYIDQDIFELSSAEVHGLLTHEIAHAAICSFLKDVHLNQPENSKQKPPFFNTYAPKPIPAWLNEAVAHFIELQSGDEPDVPPHAPPGLCTENFRRRIDAFLAVPGSSPIIASEHVLNLEERRSGSRGAATLFLAPLISTPHDLQKLLRSDDSVKHRIEDLAQLPFAEVFRNWTLAISSAYDDKDCLAIEQIDTNLKSKDCVLLGTAFHCFECSDDMATLVLTCDESAELQISIIEPAVRNDHVAKSVP